MTTKTRRAERKIKCDRSRNDGQQTDSVRSKPNLLWMFLSENQDVVVLSNEDNEEVAEAGSGN
jgi:hypothetical protein